MSAPSGVGGGGSRDAPSAQQLRRIEDLLKEHTELVAEFGLAPTVTFRQQLNRVLAQRKGDQVIRRVEPSRGSTGLSLGRRNGKLA